MNETTITESPSGFTGADGRDGGSAADRATEVADAAGSQAREVVATAVDQVHDVTGTAIEQARVVTRDAKQHVQELARQTTDELRSQAEERATQVATGMRSLAEQLRSMADNSSQDGVAIDLSRDIGQRLEGIADRLDRGDLDTMMSEAKTAARRRPGIFLAGAAVSGFLVTRFLRDAQAVTSDTGSTTSSAPSNGTGARTTSRPDTPVEPASADLFNAGLRADVAAVDGAIGAI